MTRVDAGAQLATLIQRQFAALKTPARPTGMAKHAPSQDRSAEAGAQEGLASLISRRICSIDPDDPQRGRKAFRVFLESVLLAELGNDLINDAAFYQMVDQIQLQMESDPHLGPAILEATSLLLEGKAS